MKKLIIAAAAALAMTACTSTPNPFLTEWDTPYGIPPFDKIKVSHYIPAIEAGIKEQAAEIEAIIANEAAPDFENTIAALGRVTAILFNVSESDAVPEILPIVDKALPMVSAHSDDIYMNAALFGRVKAVYEADQSALTREQQMLLKEVYDAFKRNGVDLDAEKQARLREINSELASL